MSKNLNQLFNLSIGQFDNDCEDVQIMNLYAWKQTSYLILKELIGILAHLLIVKLFGGG